MLRAVQAAIEEYGLNVAASRATTGNHVLYGKLERAVARFFRADTAVVAGSGYAANIVAAQSISGLFTHALVDERSHGSVSDALPFLNCPAVRFSHRDPADAGAKLRRLGRSSRVILLTDGLFSHDGSVAPLAEYQRLLSRDSWLLVDDAHGGGVLGANGRGSVEHCGISRSRLIQTISLSKAFGCYGGAVICSHEIREKIIARSRFFGGNTPLPLPYVAGALAAVRLLGRNRAWRKRMINNARGVKASIGLEVSADRPGPIISITPSDEAEAQALVAGLLARGVYPSLIRYAGQPGYFRFMISSQHSPAQLRALEKALTDAS